MRSKTYLYYTATKSFGVSVIVDKFIEKCQERSVDCVPITTIENIEKNASIIPYGIMEAWELRNKGYKCDCVFLVDAISLGFLNMVKFLLRNGRIFNKEFMYSLPAYLKYRYEEQIIVREAKKIMVVAQTDADYLKKISGSNADFVVIPNGASIPPCTKKSQSDHLRIGILSSWSSPRALEENKWFIDTYFKTISKKYGDIELILAGRGPLIFEFEGMANVTIMGEVKELCDFFDNVDVFLSVNPKGCGILNRVLDAFAHKTPVLGIDKSFSGFTYMSDSSYLSFENYSEFESGVIRLAKSPELRERIANNALRDIRKFNDWNINYDYFVKAIFNL